MMMFPSRLRHKLKSEQRMREALLKQKNQTSTQNLFGRLLKRKTIECERNKKVEFIFCASSEDPFIIDETHLQGDQRQIPLLCALQLHQEEDLDSTATVNQILQFQRMAVD